MSCTCCAHLCSIVSIDWMISKWSRRDHARLDARWCALVCTMHDMYDTYDIIIVFVSVPHLTFHRLSAVRRIYAYHEYYIRYCCTWYNNKLPVLRCCALALSGHSIHFQLPILAERVWPISDSCLRKSQRHNRLSLAV